MKCSFNLKERKKEIRFKKFISQVSKLEISDFLGLLKILNITAVDTNGKSKDSITILEEVFDKYLNLSNNAQKNLLSILTAANREERRGDNFGITTENPKE